MHSTPVVIVSPFKQSVSMKRQREETKIKAKGNKTKIKTTPKAPKSILLHEV
jgi:hypothetical protein